MQWVEQEVLPPIIGDGHLRVSDLPEPKRPAPPRETPQEPFQGADPEHVVFSPTTEGAPIDVVCTCLSLGGAERVGVALACGLARRGYRVRVVNTGYTFPRLPDLLERLEEAGCGYTEAERPVLTGAATIWWGKSLDHQDHIPGSIWIAHSPGEHVLEPLETLGDKVDRVIAVSQQVADRVLERTELVAKVIPNGVDPERFAARTVKVEHDELFVIGFLGRYATEKNLGVAIEALEHLPPHVRLRCYGAGFQRSKLMDLARRLNLQDRVDLGGVVPAQMALREFDCLLLCSEFEGHPLVAVEAALARVPVVYARHLGDLPQQFPDGIRGVAVDPTPFSIAAAVTRLSERPDEGALIAAQARAYAVEELGEDRMVESYIEEIQELMTPAPKTDLSDLLTVFLISSGEPSAAECRERLERQSVEFQLEEITGFTPMWKAFQEMHLRAETPYFCQVDADMLLGPTAIADLLTKIQEHGAKCAIYCAWLWGDAEERAITGVKIYRTDVVVSYPYTDSVSCDQDQFEALESDGFTSTFGPAPRTEEECAGLHYSLQTPAMAHQRWRRLMEKFRARPEYMGWLTPYPEKMRQRMIVDPTPMNLAIYEGMVAGLARPVVEDRELDASAPDPVVRRLNWLLGKSAGGPQELTLYMTSRCNHRCTWCRQVEDDQKDYQVPDISPAQVDRALFTYPTIRSVCLAGFGEPLLHRELDGVFRVLQNHGCHSTIITNGVRLSQLAQNLAGWGCKKVTVSLNAPDAERHLAITQVDTWDLVMKGIAESVPLLPTGVSAVVTNSTAKDIEAFLALALDLDVHHVHLHNLLPHGPPDDPGFLSEVVTTDSEETLEVIAQAKTLPGSELVASWPVPIDLEHCPGTCESPFVFLGLDGANFITPCRRVLPPSDFFGRLHEVTWISKTYSELRAAMLRDRPLPQECTRCFGAWSQ